MECDFLNMFSVKNIIFKCVNILSNEILIRILHLCLNFSEIKTQTICLSNKMYQK